MEDRVNARLKTTTEEVEPDNEQQKQTEIKVLQQLKDSNILKKSFVNTGVVSYNISLDNDHDSMLVIPARPDRIVKRLEKQTSSFFSREEKELTADIIKKQEFTPKGDTARIIAEKQERAKQRRDYRQKKVAEKFERKKKLTEERLNKLEQKRKGKLDQMTDAILRG